MTVFNIPFPNFYKLLFIPRFRLRSPYHGILPERHFFILSFTKDKMKQNYQFYTKIIINPINLLFELEKENL